MKINHVKIDNWETPGGPWWALAQSRPDEQMIEATIQMTLSWSEYKALIDPSRPLQEVKG